MTRATRQTNRLVSRAFVSTPSRIRTGDLLRERSGRGSVGVGPGRELPVNTCSRSGVRVAVDASSGAARFHQASIGEAGQDRPFGCQTGLVESLRTVRVTLTGDVSGDYVIVEERTDGSLVLAPDTSMVAIRRRHGVTPATLAEFEAEYGPLQPPDGEG